MSRYERNPKRPTHDRRSLSPPPLSPRCWGEPSNQHHHAHPHLDRFQKHEDRDYISQNRRERHHHHRSDHRMIRGRSFSPSEEESHHPVKRSRKRSFSDRSRSRSYSRGRQEYSISRTETSRHDDRRQNSRRRRRTSRRNGKRRERSSEDARHYSNHSRRHQEHKQQFPRHMDIPPSAGIVSDDDEHAENTVARQRSKSPGNNGRHHNKRNFDPNRSPSSHDDTVGHFQGGPGTIVADRYRIARQVGLGTFGKVMECLDLHSRNRRPSYVAMKIVRSVKRYCSSAKIEADIIRQINHRGGRGITHCVVLHDAFSYFDHYCLVFEQLGPSLYDFLKKHEYRPFPMICIQDFAVQLLEAMEFLHSFGLCHCDLKVENILLMNDREVTYRKQRVPESTRIKLIDFGGSTYYDNSKKSTCINTRQYRAPEVILAAGWSMPSDMWSLGCILAELYKGELLFPTHENLEHLALIERTIGPFPKQLLDAATKLANEAFDSDGRHRMNRVLCSESAAYVRSTPKLESLVRKPEEAWFRRLLSDILRIDPDKRSTAHECLKYLARINRDVVRVA